MPHFNAELAPALVTPFLDDESLDVPAVEKLARQMVCQGCDGLLVAGTTGESPTMTLEEKITLLAAAKKAVADLKDTRTGQRIQLMVGVGSNNTHKTVEEAKTIAALGVDALLVVVPYYNKPSQRGMIEHFTQVAHAIPDTEIVIYNIPGRCVVRMTAETMAILHRTCPNIIGVKQSFGEMDAVGEITALLQSENWLTWCGDDSLSLPMIACGAHGTISVLAHLAANPLREMIRAAKNNQRDKALQLHLKTLPWAQEIFFLPNPTVVKTCLAQMGQMKRVFRAPMVGPDEAELARIDKLVAKLQAESELLDPKPAASKPTQPAQV